jgi:high-affinity K+ transport system ATPase subunit B
LLAFSVIFFSVLFFTFIFANCSVSVKEQLGKWQRFAKELYRLRQRYVSLQYEGKAMLTCP